jgi:sugar/nucleoside kinase (ribokinase family)
MKNTFIYGIGNALVDSEYKVTDTELEQLNLTKGCMELNDMDNHSKLSSELKKKHGIVKMMPGGSVANSLYALAQFGENVIFTGRISKDNIGATFEESLKFVGMKSAIKQVEHGITGECIVMITPDHERTMYTYLGVSSDLSEDDISKEAIIDSEYLLIEGYLVTSDKTKNVAKYCLDIANENNIKKIITLSDPNVVNFFKDNMMELINKKFDIIFCNKQEAFNISSSDDINDSIKFLNRFSNEIIITSGSEGAYVYHNNVLTHVISDTVKPVDLTGAGDMFLAAYLLSKNKNKKVTETIKFANKCAGKIIQKYGAKFDSESEYKLLSSEL